MAPPRGGGIIRTVIIIIEFIWRHTVVTAEALLAITRTTLKKRHTYHFVVCNISVNFWCTSMVLLENVKEITSFPDTLFVCHQDSQASSRAENNSNKVGSGYHGLKNTG